MRLKEKKEISTIIVGDFNTPFSKMDRSYKQKINKEIEELNNSIYQVDLKDLERAVHPKTEKIHLSSAYTSKLQCRTSHAKQLAIQEHNPIH